MIASYPPNNISYNESTVYVCATVPGEKGILCAILCAVRETFLILT